jgi:hypothetical protein
MPYHETWDRVFYRSSELQRRLFQTIRIPESSFYHLRLSPTGRWFPDTSLGMGGDCNACDEADLASTSKEAHWPARTERMNGSPARVPLPAPDCPGSVRPSARRSRAVNRQRPGNRSAEGAGILRSYDSHVLPGCRSGEKNVVQDAAHLGVRAGSQGPTRAIPMHQQGHLVAVAIGLEVGPERPDIRGR